MPAIHVPDVPPTCPSRERPIDLVHLARQTGGIQSLELEVLGIMGRQIADAIAVSELPDGRYDLAATAHAICGAARNLGAFPLARAARHLESCPEDRDALDAFRRELGRAQTFIRSLALSDDCVDARRRAH